MRKAYWILFFLAVVFIGDRLLGWVLQQQTNKSQFRYSRMYRGEAEADIVVVGNSKGLNLFIPAIESSTSQKAFSLCYNGMPANLGTVLVKDYIDRYPNVNTVIVELCMVDLAEKKLITEFNSYISNSKRIDSLIKKTSQQVWYSSKLSHLYRFNNEVFQRSLYYKNQLDNDWTMDKIISDRMKSEANKFSLQFQGNKNELQYIKEIVDYCKGRNIQVKLLITPFYPDVKLQNLDSFKLKTETITGLPVYDYSKSIQSDEYFGDFLHLNQKGSEAFVRLLSKDGVLNDSPNASTISKK